MLFFKKKEVKIPPAFLYGDARTKQLLEQMVAEYNSIKGIAQLGEFQKYHGQICRLHKENKIFIYAGECDFEYLMTLLYNDGPEFSACIIFGVDKDTFYEIGVCVRGTPMLKKINIDTKETKKHIKRMRGKVGIFFEK